METSDDDDDHANEALLDSKSAYRFVSDIINNTQLSDQRHFVKTKMWDTIFDLANDFAEASIQEGKHMIFWYEL